MKRVVITAAVLCVASSIVISAATKKQIREDQNACGATVALTKVYQDNDGIHWHFLFDIVESTKSSAATSTGSFQYDYVYVDSQNMPHSDPNNQGPGWHPADEHEFQPVDTRDNPDAVSIDPQSVRIHDIVSTDCYQTRKK